MLNDQQKRALRRCVARIERNRHDQLADRVLLKDLLESRADEDGIAYIEVWSRDCDLAEGTEFFEIAAQVPAYLRLARDAYDNAEGPVSIQVLTVDEAANWRPVFRDRAAEAMGY